MSRLSCLVALSLAMAIPDLAAAQGRRDGDAPGRRGYQEHDRATDTTFTATTDAGGNAVVTLKGGDFSLEKAVSPTGDATLRLTQDKDVVTIAINQAGFQVGRGRKTLRFDPRTDKGEGLDAVRALLLGSRAVRSFKRLAASLEDRDESEEDGALAVGALVDGAIVQLLDGDLDAPKRIAKRITRKHRATIRTIKAGRAPGMFVDCVGLYESLAARLVEQVRRVLSGVDRVPLVAQRPGLQSLRVRVGPQVPAVHLAVHRLFHVSVLRRYVEALTRRRCRDDRRRLFGRPQSGHRCPGAEPLPIGASGRRDVDGRHCGCDRLCDDPGARAPGQRHQPMAAALRRCRL